MSGHAEVNPGSVRRRLPWSRKPGLDEVVSVDIALIVVLAVVRAEADQSCIGTRPDFLSVQRLGCWQVAVIRWQRAII